MPKIQLKTSVTKNPLTGRNISKGRRVHNVLTRVLRMSDATFAGYRNSSYRHADLKKIRSQWQVTDNGDIVKRPKIQLRLRLKKPKITPKQRRLVEYRLTFSVEFDHGDRGIENSKVTTTFTARESLTPEEEESMIDEAYQRKMQMSSKYNGSATGNYTVISLINLTDLGNDEDDDNSFEGLGNKGVRLMLDSLYHFKFEPEGATVHNHCVFDYLLKESMRLAQASNSRRGNHLTLKKLEKQFGSLGIDANKDWIKNKDLIKWWNEYHSGCCDLFLVDGLLNKKYALRATTRSKNKLVFVMMSTNGHLFGFNQGKKSITRLETERVSINLVRKTRHKFVDLRMCKKDVTSAIIKGEYHSDCDIIIDSKKRYANDSKVTLDKLFSMVCVETGCAPYGMQLNEASELQCFYHPHTQQYIGVSDNYEKRNTICNRLYKTYPCHQFKFRNQAMSEIASDLFLVTMGQFNSTSHYTLETQEINTKWCTTPLVCGVNANLNQLPNYSTYDYVSCYPNAIMAMDDNELIPTFEALDTWEPYDGREELRCGFYFHTGVNALGGITERAQIASHTHINFLLSKGYIKREQIIGQCIASYSIRAKKIKEFALHVKKLFPDVSDNRKFSKHARDIIIYWIGKLGKNRMKDIRACLTTCENEVNYFLKEYEKCTEQMGPDFWMSKDNFVRDHQIDDKTIVTQHSHTLLLNDHAPIMRYIHCWGKQLVYQMIEDVFIPGVSKIGTVRTDGVSGINLRSLNHPFYHRNKGVCELAPTRHIDSLLPEFKPKQEWNMLPDIHFDGDQMRVDGKLVSMEQGLEVLKSLEGKSMLLHGDGGLQKTVLMKWFAKHAREQGKTIKMLTLSARACSILKKGVSKEDQEDIMVLASFFHPQVRQRHCPDIIFVDEISQVSTRFYRLLYRMKQRGAIIILSGDFCQTGMVNAESGAMEDLTQVNRFFDLPNRRFLRELVDYNRMEKQFYPTCSRNCPELNKVVQYVKKNRRLPPRLKHLMPNYDLEVNMSFYRNTKQSVNNYWLKKKSIKGKNYPAGTPVTGIENHKDIMNGARYVVVESDGLALTVMDENCKIFTTTVNCVEPGWCDTINRYQGDKVDEPGNIFDVDRMDLNTLVTALGRFTKLDYVNLKWTDRVFEWRKEDPNPTELTLRKSKLGTIYRLDWADYEYIGRTVKTVEERDCDRRRSMERVVKLYGDEYVASKIISSYYVTGKHLDRVETFYIHDSIFYGSKENVNVKQTRDAKQRTVVVQIDTVKAPAQLVPLVRLRKNNTKLVMSLLNIDKKVVVELRHVKNGVKNTEQKLLARAEKYFADNNIGTSYDIERRNY